MVPDETNTDRHFQSCWNKQKFRERAERTVVTVEWIWTGKWRGQSPALTCRHLDGLDFAVFFFGFSDAIGGGNNNLVAALRLQIEGILQHVFVHSLHQLPFTRILVITDQLCVDCVARDWEAILFRFGPLKLKHSTFVSCYL